jgi:hypothetical protein
VRVIGYSKIVVAARISGCCGSIQISATTRPAVQSCSSSLDSSMTSGIAIHEAHTGRLAEIHARLSRTLDRPTDGHRVVPPKIALRERLRRPLLILLLLILAAFGTVYYLADEPYVSTDDAFVRAAKESINARVASQVPDCRRSGRSATPQAARSEPARSMTWQSPIRFAIRRSLSPTDLV